MPIPDYQSLMLPVLGEAAAGEVRIGEVIERLADRLGLSSEEKDTLLPSGGQTVFGNRVHWAKFYLKHAGLVDSTRRAHFQITERGRNVLATIPKKIDNAFLLQFPEFVEFTQKRSPDEPDGPSPTPASLAAQSGDCLLDTPSSNPYVSDIGDCNEPRPIDRHRR